MPNDTVELRYERALWELTRAQNDLRELESEMAASYAADACAEGRARIENDETET